jgi:Protein of unknown function (DUF2723)
LINLPPGDKNNQFLGTPGRAPFVPGYFHRLFLEKRQYDVGFDAQMHRNSARAKTKTTRDSSTSLGMTRSPKCEHSLFNKPAVWTGLVFVVSLVLYTWTLAPTVTLVDSGELILAAHSLGVAHPPGFPLYLMLAHFASIVPIGSVAQRVNFASALFAAVACGMLTLLVAELMIAAAHVTTAKRNMGQLVGRCDGQNQVSRKLREASDVTLHNPSANNLCEATALAQPSNLNKADEIPRPANRLLTARRCTNADSPRSMSGENCSSSS